MAIIRREAEPGPAIAGRLSRLPGAPPAAAVAEVVRRARGETASDEELGLALGALLALCVDGGGEEGRAAPERLRGSLDSERT